ncbi:MAG: ABC transporter permease [Promicromonosporaceae bacterium]|nr:ABC transporter permease [Promicromonosporaceae bacterium]
MSDDQLAPGAEPFDGNLYEQAAAPAMTEDALLAAIADGSLTPEAPTAPDGEPDTRWKDAAREILSSTPLMAVGAVLLAFLVGSLMIVFTGGSITEAYTALIRGSLWNSNLDNPIVPLTRTLRFATPMIAAGLGIAVTFKAGLFNIGGRGQMIFGAIGAGWLGFGLRDAGLPSFLHLIIVIIGGMLAGALWGALAGLLKAKTGAHEVIVTIMLNFVAYSFLQYLLAAPGAWPLQGAMRDPAQAIPLTPNIPDSARLPRLFLETNWGFVIALLLVAMCWWLLYRSTTGFAFRAVGENPRAARVAGISVARSTIVAFAVSGALIGFAGVHQVLDPGRSGGFADTIDGGIGFDAITVALLGASHPVGVLFAGILFGAFRSGGVTMQSEAGVPAEIATIIQILIVMFIAAPPLVRAIFRLPQPSVLAKAKKAEAKAAKQAAKAALITEDATNEEVAP